MNIYEIVSQPEQEIEEVGPLAFRPVGMGTRAMQGVGRRLGSGYAAARGDISTEANRLKKAFRKWAGGSGLINFFGKGDITLGDLEKFLNQVGYSGVAQKVISDMRNKKGLLKKTGAAVAKGAKAVGKGVKTAFKGRSDAADNAGAVPKKAGDQQPAAAKPAQQPAAAKPAQQPAAAKPAQFDPAQTANIAKGATIAGDQQPAAATPAKKATGDKNKKRRNQKKTGRRNSRAKAVSAENKKQTLKQNMMNEYYNRLAEKDVDDDDVLTNKEINAAILKAVEYGYKGAGATADKGQWAYGPEKAPPQQKATPKGSFDEKTTIVFNGKEYTWAGQQFVDAKQQPLSSQIYKKIKSDPAIIKSILDANKKGLKIAF